MGRRIRTMNKSLPITLPYYNGCYHATDEQAAILFTPTEIEAGKAQLLTVTYGPWQLLKSIRGWLTTSESSTSYGFTRSVSITFHGKRTLSRPRANGYGIVGNMVVNRKSTRVVDIAPMIQLPDERLISISCLSA